MYNFWQVTSNYIQLLFTKSSLNSCEGKWCYYKYNLESVLVDCFKLFICKLRHFIFRSNKLLVTYLDAASHHKATARHQCIMTLQLKFTRLDDVHAFFFIREIQENFTHMKRYSTELARQLIWSLQSPCAFPSVESEITSTSSASWHPDQAICWPVEAASIMWALETIS